jgi:hypothetical protein
MVIFLHLIFTFQFVPLTFAQNFGPLLLTRGEKVLNNITHTYAKRW